MANLSVTELKKGMAVEAAKMKAASKAVGDMAKAIIEQKANGDELLLDGRDNFRHDHHQSGWASLAKAVGVYAASKHEALARSVTKEMNILVKTPKIIPPDATRRKLITASIQIFFDNFGYPPELDHRLRED